MLPGMPSKAALAVLLASSLFLCGCGKTGLAWVNQPESGRFASVEGRERELPPGRVVESERAETASTAAPRAEPESQNAPRGRLTRTISLGQSVTISDQRPAETGEGPPLVVQIGPTVRPYSYGLVGPLGPILPNEPIVIDPDPIVVPEPPPAGVQPGRDWPPPRNFGPPFPYKMPPASPFEP
jgi:hypothetical protein